MWDLRGKKVVALVVSPAALVPAPIASIETVEAGARPDAGTGVLLEAKLVWGRDTIAVRHLRPRAELRLRDLALDVPGSPELVIAGVDAAGAFGLRLPNGADVPADCRMTLRMGRAVLRLTLVTDDLVMMPPPRADRRAAFGVLAAAVLHLVLLGFVAHGRAGDDAPASEQAAMEIMQRMVAAAEDRALAELAAAQERSAASAAEHQASAATAVPPAENAQKHPGVAAVPEASVATGSMNAAIVGAGTPARAADERHEAAHFGMLAVLAPRGGAPRGHTSAFERWAGPPARSDIFAESIDDAAGLGGLHLSGVGEGGGGFGGGVAD